MPCRRTLHNLNTGLHTGQPQEGFGKKAAECDSWGNSESKDDDTVISGGKKCKMLADLAWTQPWGHCKILHTQLPGLYKERHYLVATLTILPSLQQKTRSCNPHLSMKKACSGSLGSTSQLTEVINSCEQNPDLSSTFYSTPSVLQLSNL